MKITRNGCTEYKLYSYIYDPKQYYTTEKQLLQADKRMSEDIQEAEEYIAELKRHRDRLAERCQELATMNHHTECSLKRERRRCDGNKVFYILTLSRVYEDGSREDIKQTVYTGTERKQAITEFETIKKQNPHYDFIKNIEKGAWEK